MDGPITASLRLDDSRWSEFLGLLRRCGSAAGYAPANDNALAAANDNRFGVVSSVAERICTGSAPCMGANAAWKYFLTDNLGSVAVMLKSQGYVDTRLSYDAWGMRRNSDGSPMTACGQITSPTTRGFTGQEEMDGLCLVNMNARLYDPQIGRFMAPDSMVQDPLDLQSLNRYSYVLNNPLRYTDPTGNCVGIVGCFFSFAAFGVIPGFILPPLIKAVPILGTALTVASGFACGPLCAATSAAGVAGMEGGHTGDVFKAFALTYAESVAFNEIGNALTSGALKSVAILGSHDITVAVAHGFVGGIFSAASGGKFTSGFLAAGIGSFAPAPFAGESDLQVAEGTTEAAVLGGVGSIIGGGKFADGAETAAFAYLFNAAEHRGIGDNGGPPLDDEETTDRIKTGLGILGLLRASPIGAFLTALFWPTPTATDDTIIKPEGIAKIESYLASIDALDYGPNQAMIQRLQAGSATEQDLNFYEHELHESQLVEQGMDVEAAHMATLRWQNIPYEPGFRAQLFAPDVIEQYPESFNNADREAAGLP